MKFKIILIVVLVYCITMVVNLPASVATDFIPKNMAQLQGVSGTVWHGHAEQAKVKANNLVVKDINWKMDWAAILKAKLAMDVSFDNGKEMSGKGVVGYGLDGASASNVMLDITSEKLLQLIPASLPVDLTGDFSASIKEVSQGQPYCQQLDGLVVWHNAEVDSPVGNVKLASPTADLTCENGDVVVKVDQDSDQINSKFDIKLREGGKYQLKGEIKGKDQLNPSIAQSLTWIGPKNADGATTINFNGVL